MPRPLPVIAQTYRCALHWTTGQQSAVNVIHIRTDAAGVTPAAVFTLLDTHVDTGMWNPVTTAAQIDDVGITPLDGVSGTSHFATGGVAKWSGNSAGEWVPSTAVIVKFGTGLRGRSHRGRIFLPLISEATISQGFITSAQAAALGAQWDDFRTDISADATTPSALVIASYKLATVDLVTVSTGELLVGTQRRRQSRLR